MKRYLFVFLAVVFFCSYSKAHAADSTTDSDADIEVHFGVVIKNPNGEPVGFRQTTKIPHISSEPSALYGVVVTSKDETPLTLGAIHIMPAKSNGDEQKVMGKPMRVVGRGAIFLQADQEDPAGQYGVEVYINHKLFTTITYELVSEQAQVRNDKPEWLN